jgi:hypothetical protein
MPKNVPEWVHLFATRSELKAIQNVIFGMTFHEDRNLLARMVERTAAQEQTKKRNGLRPWMVVPLGLLGGASIGAAVLFVGTVAQDTLYAKTGIALRIINVPGIGNIPDNPTPVVKNDPINPATAEREIRATVFEQPERQGGDDLRRDHRRRPRALQP